jgi:hypothetical protein
MAQTTYAHMNKRIKKTKPSWACWHTLVIPALRRLMPEHCEFESSLGDKARPCLNETKKQTKEYTKSFINVELSQV